MGNELKAKRNETNENDKAYEAFAQSLAKTCAEHCSRTTGSRKCARSENTHTQASVQAKQMKITHGFRVEIWFVRDAVACFLLYLFHAILHQTALCFLVFFAHYYLFSVAFLCSSFVESFMLLFCVFYSLFFLCHQKCVCFVLSG